MNSREKFMEGDKTVLKKDGPHFITLNRIPATADADSSESYFYGFNYNDVSAGHPEGNSDWLSEANWATKFGGMAKPLSVESSFTDLDG
jgi:hypothetical protein